MRYDAILFDMDGVLLTGYHTDPSVYQEASRRVLMEYGTNVEDDSIVDSTLIDHEAFLRACEEADLPVEECWAQRERLSCELEHEGIERGERVPFDDVVALENLAASTGVVSNNRQGTVDFVVEYFDLSIDVAYGREPSLAGLDRRKPEPYYLERALADLDVEPADALFVGDRRSDVLTADNAGTDAALLAREDVPRGTPEPDYVVTSLHELPT